jgi:hypothetical protein
MYVAFVTKKSIFVLQLLFICRKLTGFYLQAAKMTVKLDGDIIMGDYITDKRYHSEGMGSIEDIRYNFEFKGNVWQDF